MKAVIVLGGDSLAAQAAEIDSLMAPIAGRMAEICLWVFCDQAPEVFPHFSFSLSGIDVLPMAAPLLPEVLLDGLTRMAAKGPKDLFVFPGTGSGPGLATRLAFRLGGSSCVQVQTCEPGDAGKLTLTKPAYGGNMEARICLNSGPFCLAPEKGAFRPFPMGKAACPVKVQTGHSPFVPDWVKESLLIPDDPGQGLEKAEQVLVAGNGVGSREGVKELERIARALGAGLGASRPVVMNGWAPMETLVGASGAILSPRVCIAAGVSGTRVFAKGIEKSQFIVAVNTDPRALIFDQADVGVVDDLHRILPELERLVREDQEK